MFSSVLKKKLNYTQSLHAQRPDHIFLVRGKDTSGDEAWYYIQVEKGKRDLFIRQGGVAILDLTEYGTVLQCGYGEQPPQHIRNLMKEEYGFQA